MGISIKHWVQPKILVLIINLFSLNFTSIEIEGERISSSQNKRVLGEGVLENEQGQTKGERGVKTRESWANVFFECLLVTHVVDNIDCKNKTFKGRETQNTNSILIQQKYVTEHTNQSNVTLTPYYNFDKKFLRSCKCLSSTLHSVKFIRAKYKLQMRKEVKDDAELEKSSAENFVWSIFCYVIAENDSQMISSWSGFQKLIYQVENTKTSVWYLPPITLPPTEMKVIFPVIVCSLDIIDELKLKHIILEVDQMLDAMFRMEDVD